MEKVDAMIHMVRIVLFLCLLIYARAALPSDQCPIVEGQFAYFGEWLAVGETSSTDQPINLLRSNFPRPQIDRHGGILTDDFGPDKPKFVWVALNKENGEMKVSLLGKSSDLASRQDSYSSSNWKCGAMGWGRKIEREYLSSESGKQVELTNIAVVLDASGSLIASGELTLEHGAIRKRAIRLKWAARFQEQVEK